MSAKRYKILVISAEHGGAEYDISPAVLQIGRSHSCDIRFTAPDVSGHHVEILLDGSGAPVMRTLSQRTTMVNDAAVAPDSVTPLHENDLIRLGDEVVLKICCIGDSETTLAPDIDPDVTILPETPAAGAPRNDAAETGEGAVETIAQTVPDAAGETGEAAETPAGGAAETGGAEDEQTILMQTRVASLEEIDLLRKRQNRGSRKKTVVYACGALICIAIIAICWGISATRREAVLTWPLDAKGKFNDEVIAPNAEAGSDFLIYFPRDKNMKVDRKANDIVAETRIGKLRDVPLRLEFHAVKSPDNLRTKRGEGFGKWIETAIRKGGKWNFDSISPVQFRGRNNGFPYLTAKYTRSVNGRSWFGVAGYMKFRDWEFVILREIPTEERWRGEELISRESFFSVAPAFIARHWEYGGQILPEPSLEEARSMLDRTSPAMWPQISDILISVMIRSLQTNDLKNFEKAQAMMAELRMKQTNWLNAEKLEYFTAIAKHRYKDAKRIRENCRQMFSDENDQRYHFIRRDQWE